MKVSRKQPRRIYGRRQEGQQEAQAAQEGQVAKPGTGRLTVAEYKAALLAKPARRANKYGNIKTIDEEGIIHDSKKEARRYRELGLLLKAREISWLARQVRFSLPGGIEYRADFVYQDNSGEIVVEDTKSDITRRNPTYRIKARLMKEFHNVIIKER